MVLYVTSYILNKSPGVRRKGTRIHLNSVSRLVSQALWHTGTMTVTIHSKMPWHFEKLTYNNKRCYRFRPPFRWRTKQNHTINNTTINTEQFSYHIHNRKCINVWMVMVLRHCDYMFLLVFHRFLSRWAAILYYIRKHFSVDIYSQLAISRSSVGWCLVSGRYGTQHVDWQRGVLGIQPL